jgi:hypothetical protein
MQRFPAKTLLPPASCLRGLSSTLTHLRALPDAACSLEPNLRSLPAAALLERAEAGRLMSRPSRLLASGLTGRPRSSPPRQPQLVASSTAPPRYACKLQDTPLCFVDPGPHLQTKHRCSGKSAVLGPETSARLCARGLDFAGWFSQIREIVT